MPGSEITGADRSRLARGRSGLAGTSTPAAARRPRDRLRALALAAPLLLLLLLSFGIPIVILLSKAVYDPTIADALPRTKEALRHWPGGSVPDDATLAAFAADIADGQASGTLHEFAKSLNARLPGA